MIDLDRLNEVVGKLEGTTLSLEDAITEDEANDTEFLRALDEQIMLCDCCGWWVEASMVNEDQVCEECVRELRED